MIQAFHVVTNAFVLLVSLMGAVMLFSVAPCILNDVSKGVIFRVTC